MMSVAPPSEHQGVKLWSQQQTLLTQSPVALCQAAVGDGDEPLPWELGPAQQQAAAPQVDLWQLHQVVHQEVALGAGAGDVCDDGAAAATFHGPQHCPIISSPSAAMTMASAALNSPALAVGTFQTIETSDLPSLPDDLLPPTAEQLAQLPQQQMAEQCLQGWANRSLITTGAQNAATGDQFDRRGLDVNQQQWQQNASISAAWDSLPTADTMELMLNMGSPEFDPFEQALLLTEPAQQQQQQQQRSKPQQEHCAAPVTAADLSHHVLLQYDELWRIRTPLLLSQAAACRARLVPPGPQVVTTGAGWANDAAWIANCCDANLDGR
jgi:hypothetical protein